MQSTSSSTAKATMVAPLPTWCEGIKPTDPNNEPPQVFFIRPLHRIVGARLHCWLSFALITCMFMWNYCLGWLRAAVFRKVEDDDYKGLKGFLPFYMKWFYGPISDGWNRPIRGPPGKYIEVIPRDRYVENNTRVAHVPDFDAPTKRCVNLGSYNYLGYGGVFPGITEHLLDCIDRSGIAVSSTPAEMGISAEQRRAEMAIAKFIGKEDAIAIPMGFATNSMVLPALVGKDGLILSDELNHASSVTGMRRAGSTVRVFRHNDMEHLEQLLREATSPEQSARWARILIVVEGLYSMEGELCPLREVVALKQRYGALLYVDEAHSIGALGPTGRGICEYFGVSTRHVDVLMGTFTKSFSSAGGYIAADASTVALLRRAAPAWASGASMSPVCAEQVVRTLEHLQSPAGRELVRRLRANSILFRRRLREAGCELLGPADTPVVPQMVRHPAKLSVFSRALMREGIASVIVGYPATPFTGLRARFCVTGALDTDEVERAADCIARVSKELCIDFESGEQARRAVAEDEAALRQAPPCELADVAWVDPSERAYTSRPFAAPGTADKPARIVAPAEAAAVTLSAQDYLGLANSAACVAAAKEAVREYGCGACGPRGFYGTTERHLELEARVAHFVGAEAAIAYSFGALVMTSVVPAYANDKQDVVFYDAEVGFSAQAGIGLAHGKTFAFAHNDMAALEKLMATVSKCLEFKKGRKYIVTEGVFANSGDIAPLPELVRLKKKYGAALIVDEAHSLGVLGSSGRGLREHWAERTGDATLLAPGTIEFLAGSLETALGSVGGFCCGTRAMMQYQVLSGLGYVFSASAPPFMCSAAVAALDAIDAQAPQLMGALARNVRHARESAAQRLGAMYDVSGDDASPVMMLALRRRGAQWPAREDDEALLERVAEACAAERSCGVCVARFVASDAARPKRPCLRVCVSARYDEAAYDAAFDAVARHTAAALCC